MSTKKLQIVTPIVTSVNGETGDVTIDAGSVAYQGYIAGAATANVSEAIDALKEQLEVRDAELSNNISKAVISVNGKNGVNGAVTLDSDSIPMADGEYGFGGYNVTQAIEEVNSNIPSVDTINKLIDAKVNYVTPETYGAIGDGSTDDTTAFANALATGLPVVGDRSKTYYVHNLDVGGKLLNCKFTGKGDDTCIILKSFAAIDYCYITGYDVAITCNGTVVHSVVRHSWITYCHKGIYLPMQELEDQSEEVYSLNNLIIVDNYFSKCGLYVNDYSHTYTDPENSAIYITGNMCGVVIERNVFEYNSYCGVYFKNENLSYLIGITIIGNYFEGNKFSPIYLKTTQTKNYIGITSNYFSKTNTNVHNTRWIAHDVFSSTCVVEDYRKLTIRLCTAGGNSLIKEDHTVIIDENTTSQYFALDSSMTFELNEPAKIIFRCESIADGKTAILLRNNTNKETLVTFDGSGEALISGSSFYLSRMPVAGDKVIIYYYGKAY